MNLTNLPEYISAIVAIIADRVENVGVRAAP